MTPNIFNLMIFVGVVHGLVLSLLLCISPRNRRSSNVLLALLLAFYSLPVLKVVLHDFGLARTAETWIWSIELLYGLGPSLYLYAKTVTDSDFALRRADLAHFLPVVIELAYYLSPFYQGPTAYALTPIRDTGHLIWTIEQVGAVVSVVVYLYLTNRLLWTYGRWVKSNYADEHRRALRWLRVPVMLYSIFFTFWLVLRVVDVTRFDDRLPMAPYYPLLLFLSFSTYWIGTKGYLETQAQTSGFSHSGEGQPATSDEDPRLGPIFMRVENLMTKELVYRENDLSLTELARLLAVNPRLLSRAINTRAKVNFHDYVNRYRVEEFQRRVASSGRHQTLLDLAHDCGFASKATFNAVFKKQTGLTPSQFKKQVLSQEGSPRPGRS